VREAFAKKANGGWRYKFPNSSPKAGAIVVLDCLVGTGPRPNNQFVIKISFA
jgi:hypothetical protein